MPEVIEESKRYFANNTPRLLFYLEELIIKIDL